LKVEIVRFGWRNAINGRENDVRSAAKRNGFADVWRAEKTRHTQEFHESPSGNGFLKVQIQLKTENSREKKNKLFANKAFSYEMILLF